MVDTMARLLSSFIMVSIAAAAFYKIYYTTNLTHLENKVNHALETGATLVGGISTNLLHGKYGHQYAYIQAVMFPTAPIWNYSSSSVPTRSPSA